MKRKIHSIISIFFMLFILFFTACSSKTYTDYDSTTNSSEKTSNVSTTNISVPKQHTTEPIEVDKRLIPYQGEWEMLDVEESSWHYIINGDVINAMYYENYGDVVEEENYIKYTIVNITEESQIVFSRYTWIEGKEYTGYIDDEGFLIIYDNTEYPVYKKYKKISNNTTLPEVNIKIEPYIGMPSSDLDNITWGEQVRVNRTQTVSGTREQWVFETNWGTYRYIYVTNGYVTAIQD